MNKWIAEFDLEDGDTMPEHMDLNYMGAKIDFHCRPMWIPVSERLPDKSGKMKEQWIVEAEQYAKDLAERIYEQITEEANYIYIDRKWYFEKVVQYMMAESKG